MTATLLQISTDWERPALTTGASTATLLIRIVAPERGASSNHDRAGIDLAFVIDRSGSMNGRPIELARQAVSQAIGMLDHRDRAALVVYDDEIELLYPLTTVDSRTRKELRSILTQVDARGMTNLCDGWLTGCRELARHQSTHDSGALLRRTILLTDGLANTGETDPAVIWKHATGLRQRGITTTALGMGEQFEQTLLAGMAEAGGGNFVYLTSANRLAHTFERELGRLTATVATKLNLRVCLPDGLHGELLNRFPVERHGHQFDIALDDLVAGDEIALVFEITSRDLTLGAQPPLEFSLRWTDPRTRQRQTDSVPVTPLEVIDERRYATLPRLPEVAAQSAILRAAADQARAMELDREGRFAESRALHHAAFDLLQAAPLDADDAQLLENARAYAAHDANVAFSEHDRKQATATSFQRARRRHLASE